MMQAEHGPGPSYRHPQPRQDCACGEIFRDETMDEAVLAYRAHAADATRPAKNIGLAGVARARQALADTITAGGESA